jgi:uncharacterized small protein (DUF1192 family)
MKTLFTALAVFLVLAAPAAAQTEQKAVEVNCADSLDAETSVDVPALDAFHEVIYPLWHTAYPAQDTTMMRTLWPQITEHVAAVAKAELPGILRDSKDAWKKGLDRLHVAELQYGVALAAHNKDALLKAAEELHSAFEGLVHTIRPALPEMADFHAVLYKIYHYDMPKKDVLSLRAHLPALEAEMDTLSRAELSERRAKLRDPFEKARAELQEKVKLVSESLKSGEWATVELAVEEMHAAYQATAKVFD